MFDGVDSSIGYFDDLIQCDEGRLQRSQLHQKSDSFLVILLQFAQLLAASGQTGQLVSIATILVTLKDRQVDT